MTPTLRPEPPDECEAYPRPTLRIPAPDPVVAYAAKRRAIDALWRDADALWDSASEAQRLAMVEALGADWRTRR